MVCAMPPTRQATPDATFVIRTDEDTWVPVASLDPDEWLDALAAEDRVTCCNLAGGFAIQADGVLWNEGAIDEIRMASTWLSGVERLLEGHRMVQVWAWEESQMTLVRTGDLVEMYDVHHSGHIVCPRVVFSLAELARALARAAEPWLTFRAAALERVADHRHAEVIRENLSDDWPERVQAILERASSPVTTPPPESTEPDPPLMRAVIVDDAAWAGEILAQEPGAVHERLSEEGGDTALHLGVERGRHALVVALLKAGADPNARGRDGATPLHVAAQLPSAGSTRLARRRSRIGLSRPARLLISSPRWRSAASISWPRSPRLRPCPATPCRCS
jgi:hypothetical protein